MRKRFNPNAVCSSENYAASKKAHQEMLQANHATVCAMVFSGKIDMQGFTPKYKTVKFFDRVITITMAEWEAHNTLV